MKPMRMTRGWKGEESPRPDPGRIKILLIDDKPANLVALESLLGDEYAIVRALSGPEALRRMLDEEFALVLLDVLMPGMDGFETAAMIRRRQISRDTPIIFITASSSNETHVGRGYSLGAVDYIYKPIVPEILRAKVHVFAELHRKTRRLALSEKALRAEFDSHKKTVEARRESEGKYRALFSRASDAIVVFDSETGAVLDANDAALTLYGYPRREFLKLSERDLAAPEEDSGRQEEGRGRAGRSSMRHRTKGGRVFPAESTSGRLVVGGRRMVMTLTRDLTERKEAEEAERLRMRDAMQRQLIATVSHELRTPISAIKASAETMRRGGEADGRSRPRFLKIIESQADRLGGLVEGLLVVAEIEAGKVEPEPNDIPLKPFIERLVKDIAPLAARRTVSIRIDVDPDVGVRVDEAHLTRILQNLLDNAIKYNRRRGSVRIEASRVGDAARVSVRDTGIGIPAEDLPLIFQQFYRTEKVKAMAIKGTGLGLFILKTLVESNGGRIWAESVQEEGAAFHFTMPLAERKIAS